jgi:regulator of sigma D
MLGILNGNLDLYRRCFKTFQDEERHANIERKTSKVRNSLQLRLLINDRAIKAVSFLLMRVRKASNRSVTCNHVPFR